MPRIHRDARAAAVAAVVFLVVAWIGFTPRYFGPMLSGGYGSPSSWMQSPVTRKRD